MFATLTVVISILVNVMRCGDGANRSGHYLPPCGDETQASRVMEEINILAPKGQVWPFQNKCGTWFFTASHKPVHTDITGSAADGRKNPDVTGSSLILSSME